MCMLFLIRSCLGIVCRGYGWYGSDSLESVF